MNEGVNENNEKGRRPHKGEKKIKSGRKEGQRILNIRITGHQKGRMHGRTDVGKFSLVG